MDVCLIDSFGQQSLRVQRELLYSRKKLRIDTAIPPRTEGTISSLASVADPRSNPSAYRGNVLAFCSLSHSLQQSLRVQRERLVFKRKIGSHITFINYMESAILI